MPKNLPELDEFGEPMDDEEIADIILCPEDAQKVIKKYRDVLEGVKTSPKRYYPPGHFLHGL